MGIFVGRNKEQRIDVAFVHTRAVYELLKENLWDKLTEEEQEGVNADFEFFEEVHLSYFDPNIFNAVYHLLMASDDDLITPLQDDFKIAFESDPRFQAA